MKSLRKFIEESLKRSDIIDSSGRQIKPIVEHLAKLIVCREGNSSHNDWPSQIDNFFNIIEATDATVGTSLKNQSLRSSLEPLENLEKNCETRKTIKKRRESL